MLRQNISPFVEFVCNVGANGVEFTTSALYLAMFVYLIINCLQNGWSSSVCKQANSDPFYTITRFIRIRVLLFCILACTHRECLILHFHDICFSLVLLTHFLYSFAFCINLTRAATEQYFGRKVHGKPWCKLHDVINECFPFSRCLTVSSCLLLPWPQKRVFVFRVLFSYRFFFVRNISVLGRKRARIFCICNQFQYRSGFVATIAIFSTLFHRVCSFGCFAFSVKSEYNSYYNNTLTSLVIWQFKYANGLMINACECVSPRKIYHSRECTLKRHKCMGRRWKIYILLVHF